MDTIFALASARGKAGVAVVRVSGPDTHAAIAKLCKLPPLRRASLRELVWQGEVLDQGLVILFAEGQSFTGEAMGELHLHGSVATMAAVMDALGQIGLRVAEPGEFTRRAFQNGKLDLTQVEGLADLIEAETSAQRKRAMRVLSGALGAKAAAIKVHIVRAAALVAALIDFSDEELPTDLQREIADHIERAVSMLASELAGAQAAERIRDGFEVAIVGPPNAGKSTLFNALAGRDAAITSPVAGTTRDVIEVRMDFGGLAVTLLDTAGLRDTDDPVEAIGVARGRERAEQADLRLVLVDRDHPSGISGEAGDLFVWNKADLEPGPAGVLSISATTGVGVDALVERVEAMLVARSAGASSATRVRHRIAMSRAVDALATSRDALGYGASRLDIVAEELASALRALDSLVGKVDVEHLLDQIFASFCIGK